ncbi:MAG: Panacea domain-containing protein [Bacteroidota bacterium]|nr:Panacea domain-containing protein [Bacteroidota bacterium]
MTQDEILKLKAVALYIISKFGEVDILRIFKILYFAEKEHYAKYGRRIVNDTYFALERGPVPSALYDAIKISQGKSSLTKFPQLGVISNSICVGSDVSLDYIITANELPDMSELSKSDILCLDKSFIENKDLDYNTLSEKSHDIAWTDAWSKSKNSVINPILIAKAAGANDAMIEYIKEKELINELIG